MVDVAAAVEVDEWLECNLCLDILLLLGFGQLLAEVVERGHVGIVVILVVQFHDLAADGGLERAVVICHPSSDTTASVERGVVRRTWQVRQCSLSTHKGRSGESCAGRGLGSGCP